MIIHEGPIKRSEFKKDIVNRLNKYKSLFLFLFFGLPILVYMPFKFKWFSSSLSKGGDIAAVALVNTGDGTGTAFLISPTHAITARHVVEGLKTGDPVTLVFEKSEPKIEVEARLLFVSENENHDYAELELVKALNDHPTLTLGSTSNASIDDEVIIIGYPTGIFSSAKAQITNNELTEMPDYFMMFGGAWPGNSGGPIIHKNTGEVIGILIAGLEGEFKGMIFGHDIDAIMNDKRFKP
jgi:S1-C subfamily serine protease